MHHRFTRTVLSCLMAAVLIIGLLPTMPAQAAQGNTYSDPAENWLVTGNRTGELDINAATTDEIMYCNVCEQPTLFHLYRVPEYTRSGDTAMNRGVQYSDGTCANGISTANLDDGRPGVNAYYTGYHWCKSVCTICGTINASLSTQYSYAHNRNVYVLYDCAAGFMVDLDVTTVTQYNDRYHTETTEHGQYCQFCHGTNATTTVTQRLHDFHEDIDPQIGNNRFAVSRHCDDCGYAEKETYTAKTVVASYYGEADGNPHTISLADLSDFGVTTSIRYGNTATTCNLTSAPNYVAAGYYNVYYAATYNYDGETMTENGVAYVQLYEDTSLLAAPPEHTHDYRYLDTVPPTCTNLGYENWQCADCGNLTKTNYRSALGQSYDSVVIREPSCTQGGMTLNICTRCGDFFTETTPITAHRYSATVIPATCRSVGYTDNKCADCGHSYITDITQLVPHSYRATITPPTCTERGYTTHVCDLCGDIYVDTYTAEVGHNWNGGEALTSSTCEGEGVTVFTCTVCGETMLQAVSANGHRAGAAATCTEPQTCLDCGAILALPLGHSYTAVVTAPTCTSMGYTVYECEHGDHSYATDYTDKLPHDYRAAVTAPTCETMGYTTYVCAVCGDSYVSDYTDVLPHTYTAAITDATCTEMGYTVYTCDDCGDTYTGDYTNPLGHDYRATVTDLTCTAMGYTTYVCAVCGDSYVSDYTDSLGHSPSGWIVDTPATLDADGSKHIECLTCGEILNTAVLARLNGSDYTDNNGRANVGGYVVIVTDSTAAPVPHALVTIDIEDNIGVTLPDGRLLDFADQTTVTVLELRDNLSRSVPDLFVTVTDGNGNAAVGVTDEAGQITVPNSATDTAENGNGTIGGNELTLVVTVTDNYGAVVDDCTVLIDEDGVITVELPSGTPFDRDNPVTVTVTDNEGKPLAELEVVIQDETGVTGANGKITLPETDRGYTNDNGVVRISGYVVTVEDTETPIARAFVTYTEDGEITVLLPEPYILTADNQTTVTVLLAENETPVKSLRVTVFDYQNRSAAKSTNTDGKITVPDKPQTGGGGGGYVLTPAPAPAPTPVPTPPPAPIVITHAAYVEGCGNGLFKPDDNMTRAEAATIFARLLSERRGEKINGAAHFPDIASGEWYAPYVGYLKDYGIITGYPDGTFRPEATITRAEFVTMAVRFNTAYNNTAASADSIIINPFLDVSGGYWAMTDISTAAVNGWIVGYVDGTFKGDNEIIRAEAVTIVNRVLGRVADKSYIDGNRAKLTRFSDVPTRYWAYYDIMEAANTHSFNEGNIEAWSK